MPWLLDFKISYPHTKVITEAIWDDLWEMAEVQGLGAARPRGYGKFKVEKMDRGIREGR
jgi:CRISPR/Cas system CSM-associated protein Csm4 (group 5 of RAMP superfamily)